MMKRNVFFMFFIFLGSTSLFSSPRQEAFLITNLSSKELIINFEYHEFETTRITINDVGVDIRYTDPNTISLLRPNRYTSLIYYGPVINLTENNDIEYFYDRLFKIPFCNKAKTFFKSFSIYTGDGECIIRDIDELCATSIRQDRLGYNLVFFDSGTYLTDDEQERAIDAVLWPNGRP